MRLGWLSDIHLNFLTEADVVGFFNHLATTEVEGWLLSGDIGEAPNVAHYLQLAARYLRRPVYFVLGNHDYYRGSMAGVNARMEALSGSAGLIWLTASDPVELAAGFSLVGEDGWGDGRLGNPSGSPVLLNDFRFIEELTGLSRAERVAAVNQLGAAGAARLAPKLEKAAAASRRVCVVTHVPPFAGSAWHEGQPSGPDWLPWFACEATGQAILDCAGRHAGVEFVVLCGHTHGVGVYQAASNVVVHTAAAEYGYPALAGVVVQDGSALWVQEGR